MKKNNKYDNIYWQLFFTGAPALTVIVLFLYSVFGFFIPTVERQYLHLKRVTAQNIIQVAQSTLSSFNQQVIDGKLSLEEAQAQALTTIQTMRYGQDSKDYLWLMNTKSEVIMHPYMSNEAIDKVNNPEGPFRGKLFVIMRDAGMQPDGGFVDYRWQWKDDPTRQESKTSYLNHFKPWGWIIGTGVYLADMKQDLSHLRRQTIYIGFGGALFAGFLTCLLAWRVFAYGQRNRETTKALAESEEDLRLTLESTTDAVITTNENGKIERINQSAEALTGWPIEQAIGKDLHKVLSIKKSEESATLTEFEAIVKLMLEKNLDNSGPFLLTDTNSTEHFIDHSFAYKFNKDNAIIGSVLTLRDITERNILQQKLEHSAKMDSIGKLAGGVAHDFNNMLGGIRGAADLILCSIPTNSPLSKYVKIIIEASSKAADLTNKLLAFARKSTTVTELIDVHGCIHDAIDILEHTIDKRITIDARSLLAHRSKVMGDASQIQNVFLNLGTNARDAMPDGGTLSFSTSNVILEETYCNLSSFDIQPGEYIKICITDTGCGIPADIQKKVFEPFFTTKTVGKGTGLGLSAVYGTVTNHKGAINIYSESDTGTAFYIFLPVCNDLKKHKTTVKVSRFKGVGTVLVIDDEVIMRKMAKALLENLGYTVFTAQNGSEGIEVYRKYADKIELVLLDMIMPEMNGSDCFLKLKEISPDIKVIISSGFSQEGAISNLHKKGVSGFISKPYSKNELAKIVHDTLTETSFEDSQQ